MRGSGVRGRAGGQRRGLAQSPTCIPAKGAPSAEGCVTCDAPDDCAGEVGRAASLWKESLMRGRPQPRAQLALFASCSDLLLAGV